MIKEIERNALRPRGVGFFYVPLSLNRDRGGRCVYLEQKNMMVNKAPMIHVPILISLTLPVKRWMMI